VHNFLDLEEICDDLISAVAASAAAVTAENWKKVER